MLRKLTLEQKYMETMHSSLQGEDGAMKAGGWLNMPGEKRAKTHIQNSEIQLFIISFSIMKMCTPYELFFAAFLSLRAEKHDGINYVQLYPLVN